MKSHLRFEQPPSPPLVHALSTSDNSLHLLSASGCLDPALAEEDGSQTLVHNAEDDAEDDSGQGGAGNDNADGDDDCAADADEEVEKEEDVLDAEEEEIINDAHYTLAALLWFSSPSKPSLKMSSATSPTSSTCKEVLKLLSCAARRRGICSAGKQKKVWISDDTVAAKRAGVWNSTTHDT